MLGEPSVRDELLSKGIILVEAVDESFLHDVIIPFHKLSSNQNIDHIKLIIDSPGGSVVEMFQLMTLIRKSTKPVVGEIMSAYSAGFMIASQCHHRIAYEGSIFMHHRAWTFAVGNITEITAQTKYMKAMDERAEEMLLERSNIKPDVLAKHREADWYMTAREAHKYGIVDEIIDDAEFELDPAKVQAEIKRHRKALKTMDK